MSGTLGEVMAARSKPVVVPPATIGWREWVALPALGVARVKAKIDTGARSSALHAVHVTRFMNDAVPFVRFAVHPDQRTTSEETLAEARVLDERTVRSSSGHASQRYVIETQLELGEAVWTIELTLTPRPDMGFRMLIGREAVRGRFLVDPGRSFLLSQARTTSARRRANPPETPQEERS